MEIDAVTSFLVEMLLIQACVLILYRFHIKDFMVIHQGHMRSHMGGLKLITKGLIVAINSQFATK